MSASGLLPARGECQEVLAIKCDKDSVRGSGKGELILIGKIKVSSLPGGCAIHALFSQHPRQYHRHVFIQVEPH